MCCIAGVPFLVMKSNCQKIEGLLADIGCPELLINHEKEVTPEKIKQAKDALPKIVVYAEKARQENVKLFKMLGEL